MATTSNFGWTTPDDTDLVKDGALAIRTLGNNIDTSLVDLKGGTTGQILSKNSNSDLDYTWINNDQGDITEVVAGTGLSGGGTSGSVTLTNTVATEFDAKGDLVVGTGADTFDKLTAGSNGETLVADSSTTTGLRWQEPKAGNPVINSAFQIWQRGTSISVAASTPNAYTADRWAVVTGANVASTISRQVTNDTTNLPNIQYCGRFQRNSGQTGTAVMYISNSFETVNSIPFVGKTVTFSFYARKGADYSAASSILVSKVYSGTGIDQQSNTGYTGASAFINQNNTLTTTWQRFTATGTISTSATELSIELSWTPVGTASTNDYFEVTGVQLEVGSVATPFKTQGVTLAGELAACQRYYYRQGGSNSTETFAAGFMLNTTSSLAVFNFPVTMRVAPTAIDFATLFAASSGGSGAITALALNNPGRNTTRVDITNNAFGGGGAAIIVYANSSTSAYVGFSAEL